MGGGPTSLKVHGCSASSTWKAQFLGIQLGWIGLRSMPIIFALGKLWATSIAQIPVPVPMSRMRVGLWTGARKREDFSSANMIS